MFLFSGTWGFEGAFRLQVKKGSRPYHIPPQRVAHALQDPLREELD